MSDRSRAVVVQIHDQADSRIERILRLVDQAAAHRPLPAVLATLCEQVSTIAPADVVSVYVRETSDETDELVMRANVGLRQGAVGSVRLRIGEGITGFAAECLRPVSSAFASADVHFKPVPGLGEERFPCFLALPLILGGRATGVLVMQRQASAPFHSSELVLATALAGPFLYALESARARGTVSEERKSTPPARDIRLSGHPLVRGYALGRAWPLASLDTLSEPRGGESVDGPAAAVSAPELIAAVEKVSRGLLKTIRKLHPDLSETNAMTLRSLALMLEDERFREQAVEHCATRGLAHGLREVVRGYARTPYRLTTGSQAEVAWLSERVDEIVDLCLLVAARIRHRRICSAGDTLIVGGRLSAFMALAAVARRCASVIVGEPVPEDGLPAAILLSAGIPTIVEVAGVFEWARQGDRLLVDGGIGSVRVNPAPNAIARMRAKYS